MHFQLAKKVKIARVYKFVGWGGKMRKKWRGLLMGLDSIISIYEWVIVPINRMLEGRSESHAEEAAS